MFTHELVHGFANDKLKAAYRNTYKNDAFTKKCNYILWNKKASTSDEEEFVVALEYSVSLKNGVMSKAEAYDSIFNYYESCMPIAVIVFNELVNLNQLPDDINSWIYNLFENGTIKIIEIEDKVNRVLREYISAFNNRWVKDSK